MRFFLLGRHCFLGLSAIVFSFSDLHFLSSSPHIICWWLLCVVQMSILSIWSCHQRFSSFRHFRPVVSSLDLRTPEFFEYIPLSVWCRCWLYCSRRFLFCGLGLVASHSIFSMLILCFIGLQFCVNHLQNSIFYGIVQAIPGWGRVGVLPLRDQS